MASKIVEVPMHEISVDFYVRQSLSEDRVAVLTELVKSGNELPPIILNDKNQIIDGRHRYNAYRAAGKSTIKAEIRKDMLRGEQILEALTSNMGGSLPPTQADMRLAIQNMLAAGLRQGAIVAGISLLPASTVKRYIKEAQSSMVKQKLRLAVDAVANDMTIPAAAAKFSVSIESLKLEITGKKRKDKEEYMALPKIKAGISNRNTTYSHQQAKMFQGIMQAFTDGDMPFKEAMDAVDHAEKVVLGQVQNIAGWRMRFEAARRNVSYNA